MYMCTFAHAYNIRRHDVPVQLLRTCLFHVQTVQFMFKYEYVSIVCTYVCMYIQYT